MSELFKKTFCIVKDTPLITLYFVIYLIVLTLVLPVYLTSTNKVLVGIIALLILLLTSAFFSGWFGMIKTSLSLYTKENKTPETKIEELAKLRGSFFENVPTRILPVMFGFILFIALIFLFAYLSDYLFGDINKVVSDISEIGTNAAALKEYVLSMPDETWTVIIKKGIFSYVVYSILVVRFIFYAASLFLNKDGSSNPFKALLNSAGAIFKTFFTTLLILLLIMFLNFILISVQLFYVNNVIISFLTMILRIYFAAYIIVLIFDLYEKSINCDNRPDSIGENETCDKPCEGN